MNLQYESIYANDLEVRVAVHTSYGPVWTATLDLNLSITLFLSSYFFLVQGSECARVDGTTVEMN